MVRVKHTASMVKVRVRGYGINLSQYNVPCVRVCVAYHCSTSCIGQCCLCLCQCSGRCVRVKSLCVNLPSSLCMMLGECFKLWGMIWGGVSQLLFSPKCQKLRNLWGQFSQESDLRGGNIQVRTPSSNICRLQCMIHHLKAQDMYFHKL